MCGCEPKRCHGSGIVERVMRRVEADKPSSSQGDGTAAAVDTPSAEGGPSEELRRASGSSTGQRRSDADINALIAAGQQAVKARAEAGEARNGGAADDVESGADGEERLANDNGIHGAADEAGAEQAGDAMEAEMTAIEEDRARTNLHGRSAEVRQQRLQ